MFEASRYSKMLREVIPPTAGLELVEMRSIIPNLV
jgi:hypothetical protein